MNVLKGIKGKNNEVSHHVPKMERIEGQKFDRPECMTQVGQTKNDLWLSYLRKLAAAPWVHSK